MALPLQNVLPKLKTKLETLSPKARTRERNLLMFVRHPSFFGKNASRAGKALRSPGLALPIWNESRYRFGIGRLRRDPFCGMMELRLRPPTWAASIATLAEEFSTCAAILPLMGGLGLRRQYEAV